MWRENLGAGRLFSLCLMLAAWIVCGGCSGRELFLGARDQEIKDATQAIQNAPDDAQRAKAHSARGVAYSEKARYSRVSKLISDDEYERLFALAIQDHNEAVTLNPASAEAYFNRAQAYLDRGSLDLIYVTNPFEAGPRNNQWLHAATVDFEKAVERDPKNSLAYDRLGIAYESNGEADQAIRAYTQEMTLNPRLSKLRLAGAYCIAGYKHQMQKEWGAAVTAYEKSIEYGPADDKSCPAQPFAAMAAIYTLETREYDKAWDTVHRAEKEGGRIGSELIERLKKDSDRKN